MKILMLVNWNVEYCNQIPYGKQPPDYFIKNGETPYWFFRYFPTDADVTVDVVDTHSFKPIEHFEKHKLHFYILQTLRILPRLKQYDVVLSHGMQSGIVLSLWRRLFKHHTPKHIVFDIGAFNSAKESGFMLKVMQYASKSIDGIIYHTSQQRSFYETCYPWILEKSRFIRFGTDFEFMNQFKQSVNLKEKPYLVCVGYAKRDWDTLIKAFELCSDLSLTLKLIGNCDEKYRYENVELIETLSMPELIQEISSSLFCVLPLEYFNYSFGQMTLLQQMALGKAVITARVPSMTDYVTNHKNALLYEPKNIDALTQCIHTLYDDAVLRKDIEKNALDYVRFKNNEQKMALEIWDFINETVS